MQVSNLIQQRLPVNSGGQVGLTQQLQQGMEQAKEQLNKLKEKINQVTGGSSDMEMPDFRPNPYRSKSFFKRLELSTNLQTQKASYYFPSTGDIGLSIGYKLNDKSIVGLGGSWKIGFGSGWRNIQITHQGASVRSFLDWKLKGSFWVSGGYEKYFQPITNSPSAGGGWGEAGLIGLSKVVSLKSKFFKKTKLQLLWDFLSYEQVPRTQTIKFRVGYSF